ncbi:MAG: hypothetical protein OJJ54_05815 [Pseudonocardia sp.]|nr:hypothetical protein [Pseudonocardia sp.]
MDIAKPAYCPSCARIRTVADARGLEWSSHHSPGGTVSWLCGPCTRDSVFEIETGQALIRAAYSVSA